MSPAEMAMRALVALAKRCLADANKGCGDNWPARQSWRDLCGSSQGAFLQIARDEAGIDHASYKAMIRNAERNPADGEDLDQTWRDLE